MVYGPDGTQMNPNGPQKRPKWVPMGPIGPRIDPKRALKAPTDPRITWYMGIYKYI